MSDIYSTVQCLVLLAQTQGVAVDANRVIEHYGLAAEPETTILLRIAADIGLDGKSVLLSIEQLLREHEVFPVIARLNNGRSIIVVDVKKGEGKIIFILDPLQMDAVVRPITIEDFRRNWSGELITLQKSLALVVQGKLAQAISLHQQSQLQEAAVLFREVLSLDPANGGALYSLAAIAAATGDPRSALDLATAGIQVSPDFASLWTVRGSALQSLERKDEALSSYKEALRVDPNDAVAMVNCGVLLRDLHRHYEAVELFNRALTVNPDSTVALANCGVLLSEFKKREQAIAMFKRLLQIKPEYDYGLGLLFYEQLHICDWQDAEHLTKQIVDGIRAGKRSCKTLALMAISDSAEEHFLAAKIFSSSYCPKNAISLWNGESYRHEKLRIAYVSPDLREHPVGHLMAGIFDHHDKTRFEVSAISLGIDDQSRLRSRIINAFDNFIDCSLMGTRQIAEKIREMEIDVLIDLAGYTSDSRMDIFAYRPAPLQISYLGYPGTLGTDYMDYIIADRHVIPSEHQSFYSEQVVYLPDTYLPTDNSLSIADPGPTKKDCGLPENSFVFCSFSHVYKISPQIFATWMRLLQQVSNSVLWLTTGDETSQTNLQLAAERVGVDPKRLIFANRIPRIEDHLARYRNADLFLDTHPYNAHTTAADALMAGLPVVTYMGNAFPARVAGSLLHAVGLPELVGSSVEEYESLALKLATNAPYLKEIKQKLINNRNHCALFNTKKLCRNLEEIYLTISQQSSLAQQTADRKVLVEKDSVVHASPIEQKLGDLIRGPANNLLMAEKLFHEGNLPQAELYLRLHASAFKDDSQALLLSEKICASYGLPNGFKISEKKSFPSGKRFFLIKAWGYGFWSEIHHVLNGLLLSEMTGRIPVILWGSNCLYRQPTDVNAFEHFFHSINNEKITTIKKSATFYPKKWSWDNIYQENVNKWEGENSRISAPYLFERSETVVVSDFYITMQAIIPWIGKDSSYYGLSEDEIYNRLFKKYLKPIPAILSKVNDFFVKYMQTKPWVAVHVRGSDKVYESSSLDQTNESYFGFISRIVELNPNIGIFLLTDSSSVVSDFATRYGQRLLCTAVSRTASDVGVHINNQNGVAIGEEVLIDVLLATKCQYFIGNQESNVSLAIASMGTWRPGFMFLLGTGSARGDNVVLHDRVGHTLTKEENQLTPSVQTDKVLQSATCYDSLFAGYRDKSISLLDLSANKERLIFWGQYFSHGNCFISGHDGVTDWQKEGKNFDIIVDSDCLDTLALFVRYFPLVESGGGYLIENTSSFYNSSQGSPLNDISVYSFFKKLVDVVNINCWESRISVTDYFSSFFTADSIPKFIVDSQIASIEFTKTTIFIKKACC